MYFRVHNFKRLKTTFQIRDELSKNKTIEIACHISIGIFDLSTKSSTHRIKRYRVVFRINSSVNIQLIHLKIRLKIMYVSLVSFIYV